MAKVSYEQVTGLGKPWHEAIIEIGAFSLVGRGETYAAALEDLLSRLEWYSGLFARALEGVGKETAPATPEWE